MRAGALQDEGTYVLKSPVLRRLLWTVGTVLVLGITTWLAVPPLLKWQLETRGSELLGRDIRVGEVKFSLIDLALTLTRLSVAAAPGSATSTPQLQIERLFVDIDSRSLLRLAPVIDAIEIDVPQLHIARVSDGHYDIDDLLQRFAQPAQQPEGEPQRFALFNLRLSGGQVRFDDQPFGQQHELRNITLDLPFLSNLPDDLQIKVEPRLAFELNGSAFDSRGRTTPFAQGRASEFDLRFDGLDLARWWAYLPESVPVKPVGGKLWTELKLRFEQHAQSGANVELQGQVEVRDMVLKAPDESPLLSWQSLRIRLANVQPLQRRVALEAVHLDGAAMHVRRDAAGELQLARLNTTREAPPAAQAEPAGAGWQLQLPLLEINAAQLHWQDATLQPAAEASLEGIQLRLKQLRWPVEDDATLQLEARLLSAGAAVGQFSAKGKVSDRQARIALQLKDFELAATAPYLRPFLQPRASGRVSAVGELDWAQGEAPRQAVTLSSLRIDNFELTQEAPASAGRKRAATAPRLAGWQSLLLEDVRADLLQRSLSLGTVSLQAPAVELARDKAGALNVAQWFVAADGEAVAAPSSDTPAAAPWRVELAEFKLDGGRASLADAALPAVVLQLGKLRARAQRLAWPIEDGAKAVDTQLSAELSVSGARGGRGAAVASTLDWRGGVTAAPLAANGNLRLERLPVHVFEPYFGAMLPVTLQRAEAGFSGKVDVRQSGAAWLGRIEGDALLADVRIDARRVDAARSDEARELLSWNALSLKGLKVGLEAQGKPNVEVAQLRLSDYYAQLEITEEGRLYLQTLAPGDGDGDAAAPPTLATAGPDAAGGQPRVARLPVNLALGEAVFTNGRVAFNDRFIRPNYSADLSDLYGRIGSFDSRASEPATLQFSGVVAGTGVLSIEGEVNPTVEPPALDIKAKATGIDLPGLTPYSAKYAGYPIERGKLSVDVAYKIASDGKLEASNKIIVNQLTFGEKSDSPDATTLPVRLAVALLQDQYGVIDIDLPVSGSINDPQFSIGSLIVKAIVNLLTKVLTAPFSMLAGVGGDDLSVVNFAPGSASIDGAGQKVIDQVAKALSERPALKLSVLGAADAATETPNMQRAALDRWLLEEQRRERARGSLASNASPDAPLPPLSAEARAKLVRQLYLQTALPGKPAGSAGAKADLPVAEMETQLAAAVDVDASAVRQLALQRGRAVRDALVAKGLASDRLFLSEPESKPAAADNPAPKPMAQLSLSPL